MAKTAVGQAALYFTISRDRVLRHGMFITAKKRACRHGRSVHSAGGFRTYHRLVKQGDLPNQDIALARNISFCCK
jgi:hypothetical protein